MPVGRAALDRRVPQSLQRLEPRLPVVLIETLREQFARLRELDQQIEQIEQRLRQWHQGDTACQRIAAMGDAQAFKSGREFAAWLGSVPDNAARVDGSACWASANAETRISERC